MESPEFGQHLPPCRECNDTLELLWRRRSTPADFMTGPGPNDETLQQILTIGARVPDHRRVVPFRFVVFKGDGRERFGRTLEAAYRAAEPEAEENRVAFERDRFLRAPVVVAVISNVDKAHRTPEWEQILVSGAVCQNLLIASSAAGFAAQWITEWYAFDKTVLDAMGCGPDERIAGYIYIGTASEDPKERARPVLNDIVEFF